MGTATHAITEMIIEIAREVNNLETFALSSERRLRLNSSQSSGGSHSSNREHQSDCSHIHLLCLGEGEHIFKTPLHTSNRTNRDFFSPGVEDTASLPVEQIHDRVHICVGCGLEQIAAPKREKIGTFRQS